jgi:hypothetical protein
VEPDERAARALARVKANPRKPATAVLVRCSSRGHVLLSAHPLGSREFLVWRRGGRVVGSERDAEQWQRQGGAAPGLAEAGIAPIDELALIVSGPDVDSPRGLLGIDSAVLACACGRVTVGSGLADDIGAAITTWWVRSRAGSWTPIVVIVK